MTSCMFLVSHAEGLCGDPAELREFDEFGKHVILCDVHHELVDEHGPVIERDVDGGVRA